MNSHKNIHDIISFFITYIQDKKIFYYFANQNVPILLQQCEILNKKT